MAIIICNDIFTGFIICEEMGKHFPSEIWRPHGRLSLSLNLINCNFYDPVASSFGGSTRKEVNSLKDPLFTKITLRELDKN